MKIIGCVNGNNPDDKRCTDHVDFANTGRTLWEGEEFDCTYCGQAWRKGPCTCEADHTTCVHHDHDKSYGTPDVCDHCTPVTNDAPAVEALPADSTELPGNGWGRWTVYRNGGTVDAMTGYGRAWAEATATWVGSAAWVTEVRIRFVPLDSNADRPTATGAAIEWDAIEWDATPVRPGV